MGEYETKYYHICLLMKNFDRRQDQVSVHSSRDASCNSRIPVRKYKLPLIELKKYDGDLKGWLPFWSQFSKIHDDSLLDDSDKYQYLIQCTVKGSRAWNVVNSYPPTAENYPKAIESLKTRFGQEKLLIQVYVRELIALVVQKSVSNVSMNLANLYDKLEGQLRSLETLGVTSEKYECMLFPLVESCLPEELLRVWQRKNALQKVDESSGINEDGSLMDLLNFIKSEVESEEKISLAMSGFGSNVSKNKTGDFQKFKRTPSPKRMTSTAAGLLVNENKSKIFGKNRCLFCDNKNHISSDCFKARDMPLENKLTIIKDNKCCYVCFKPNHTAKLCRSRSKCIVCEKGHHLIMCSELHKKYGSDKTTNPPLPKDDKIVETDKTLTSLGQLDCKGVFLQTLIVKVRGKTHDREARAIIDSGSQRSYILKSTASDMGYEATGEQVLIHSLFGGGSTEQYKHKVHKIYLQKLEGNFRCNFDVLDQPVICEDITHVTKGPWIDELTAAGVTLSDIYGNHKPIEILIGADVAGKILTGKRLVLECGLVALETDLGWTLMGKVPQVACKVNVGMSILSMFVKEADVSQLWALDTIGITDAAERKSKDQLHAATQDHFDKTVSINNERRYEVHLPWTESKVYLSTNYTLSLKRLEFTLRKLISESYYDDYDRVFKDWLLQGIIEDISDSSDSDSGHFLPHRHVIKLGSTTPVRPVFDASAKEKHKPSLNDCLDKGPNLVELIPEILLRFRINEVGAISDIKQAFLQISICQQDRQFLKFIWKDKNGKMIVFQHCRVVFGVTTSPFLLTAVIRHHLQSLMDNNSEYISIASKLMKSFYVDNCVASVSKAEIDTFVDRATAVMKLVNFDLRGWVSSSCVWGNQKPVNVLGLVWNPDSDTIQLCENFLEKPEEKVITKRVILKVANRIYDPMGFTCPVSIEPKLLLQICFERKYGWDQEVDIDIEKRFVSWVHALPVLGNIKIPRWVLGVCNSSNWSVHVFCDASRLSYAAAIFLRSESNGVVNVQLLSAKSRIAPSKKGISIPRLELLAALIGARLHAFIEKSLEGHEFDSIFWSDSSTVLAWIQRDDQWATFVKNRVHEIRALTSKDQWHHVPGSVNPADLPSRGCSAKQLVNEKWWEGPDWLRKDPHEWPSTAPQFDENIIVEERRKTLVVSMVDQSDDTNWYYRGIDRYESIVRRFGWIYRFYENSQKHGKHERMLTKELTTPEIIKAENKLLVVVQRECFAGENNNKIVDLCPFTDLEGIIRTKSKIASKEDTFDFRNPIILLGNHPVVQRLVLEAHQEYHLGVQALLASLRERFWIIGGRRLIRSVVRKCVTCRRQTSKRLEAEASALPIDRVTEVAAFEVTGVDVAGPLYLKPKKKIWICVFVCAVYRAIHLELLTAMTTESFLQTLRRFIARRGRPRVIYSDNGTNFVGAANALNFVDNSMLFRFSSCRRIKWKFMPVSSPWWGGWWERMIGILKRLLRRILGNACLTFEEMFTILCDCESVINSRPITYVSDDPADLVPITPSMFIQDIKEVGAPDLDKLDKCDLKSRLAYRQKLKEDLRRRFRAEYLGQLKHRIKGTSRAIQEGEIVLVGSDDKKRLDWPMAKVIQLIPGRDGKVRLVKLKTEQGEILRPVQRIYPLEINSQADSPIKHWGAQTLGQEEGSSTTTVRVPEEAQPTSTRYGRVSKAPKRYET